MADEPLVTVIVNCYNHARWLEECLESVRRQTYRSVQLIIMDDCSVDGSADLIRTWIERTGTACTFVANTENRGLAATRNAGFGLAEAPLVSWVSTDDIWLPRKLEAQVRTMQDAGRGTGVVYSDADRIDADGLGLGHTMLETTIPQTMPPRGDVFDVLVRRNFVPSLATLVRLDCVKAVGGYDPHVPVEDWDLWLRLAREYRFAFSPYISARLRIVPTSRWHSLSESEWQETQLRIAEKHIGYRPSSDPLLRERLADAAVCLTAAGHPDSAVFLRKALRAGPPHRTVPALAAASARTVRSLGSPAARRDLRRERGRVRVGSGAPPAP